MNMNATLPVVWNVSNAVVDFLWESTANETSIEPTMTSAPEWMVQFVAFRKRLFLRTVEPIIETVLGPVEEDVDWLDYATNEYNYTYEYNETLHRRLGFLPEYVENASAYRNRETSMSFATLITLIVSMSSIFVVFLSCFYHNQKTSPLFISPRRHRLPKLVPPPLPVDGYFDWVSLCSQVQIYSERGRHLLKFIPCFTSLLSFVYKSYTIEGQSLLFHVGSRNHSTDRL